MNKDGVKVAVLTFTKSAYRLGETVLGVVELNERTSKSRVLQVSFVLFIYELYEVVLRHFSPAVGDARSTRNPPLIDITTIEFTSPPTGTRRTPFIVRAIHPSHHIYTGHTLRRESRLSNQSRDEQFRSCRLKTWGPGVESPAMLISCCCG